MYRGSLRKRWVPIVLIGTGKVGSSFRRHVEEASAGLKNRGVDVTLAAIVRRDRVLVGDALEEEPFTGWPGLIERFMGLSEAPILVDATPANLIEAHLRWIRRGWKVVTANKVPMADAWPDACELYAAADDPAGCRYWCEATVGAGLPVVRTLRELIATGDEDIRVVGTPSGTLNYLCASRDAHLTFKEALAAADARGLTEPDPREDLRGVDAFRKALILRRMMPGRASSTSHEPFLPEETLAGPRWLRQTAGKFEGRYRAARRRKASLRYVIRVSDEECHAGLEEVSREDAYVANVDTRSRFVFTSRRYPKGFEVLGPGAGPEETATAVFGDVLRAAGLL